MSEQKTRRPKMGLVYRSARLYRLVMRILERGGDARRFRMIAARIEAGSEVVDLCCGDAAIAPLLVAKGCTYVGLDINPTFVRWGRRKRIDVRQWDGTTMDIPEADVICLLSSLYQFLPDDRVLIDKMLRKARKLVVVSEPVSNWASSGNATLRWISRVLTRVDGRVFDRRHTQESLRELVAELPAKVHAVQLPREVVLFIEPRHLRQASRRRQPHHLEDGH